jgi:hypothetical protein
VGVINGIRMVSAVHGRCAWLAYIWTQSTIMVDTVNGRCAWLACGRNQL